MTDYAVESHRTGDRMPTVVRQEPAPTAVDLCQVLAKGTVNSAPGPHDSPAGRGWNDPSDLFGIVIHESENYGEGRKEPAEYVLAQPDERHFPGCQRGGNPCYGIRERRTEVSPEHYVYSRYAESPFLAGPSRRPRSSDENPGPRNATAMTATSLMNGNLPLPTGNVNRSRK